MVVRPWSWRWDRCRRRHWGRVGREVALVPARKKGYSDENNVLFVLEYQTMMMMIMMITNLYEPPLLTVTLTPFCSLGSLRKKGDYISFQESP